MGLTCKQTAGLLSFGEMFSFVIILFSCHLLVIRSEDKLPTIYVSILVRNKAHTLPYFLTLLQHQNYDKRRLILDLVSDHNEDNSVQIVRDWVESISKAYHSVKFEYDERKRWYAAGDGPGLWSDARFAHVINLREAALDKARQSWAQFLFVIDADVFLTNPNTLLYLVNQRKTVVAPMLKSTGMYSNFWGGMTENFYYTRTEDYPKILKGEIKGCFAVPMVHSAVLINLQTDESDSLTYNGSRVPDYQGPKDDIIAFAVTANMSGVPMYVCNENLFGFVMVPLESDETLEFDKEQLINLKLDVLTDGPPLLVTECLQPYVTLPSKDTLDLDAIYVINLARRRERRERMEACFNELGMDVRFVEAVDGRLLDDEALEALGISQMPEYKDPYHKRPMKLGEIGCFLSHYQIWEQVNQNKEGVVMILEDDVRFEPFFRRKFLGLMKEISDLNLDWDLIYLGRKRLKESEDWVEGSKSLVYVTYSYWTLGYLLTNRGAHKLLRANPLSKLLPVDEYLPIMFDKHPEETWKAHFPRRDLLAFSVQPLFIYPTHYTGESGYISDTEESVIVRQKSNIREDL